VGSLGVGLSGPGSVALPIPASTAAGGYYIIAKADGANAIAEAAENNNTRARLISITAP
jgi:subtilase family serine protease